MSKFHLYTADASKHSTLACKLPRDDEDAKFESSLLRRWGFDDAFFLIPQTEDDDKEEEDDNAVETDILKSSDSSKPLNDEASSTCNNDDGDGGNGNHAVNNGDESSAFASTVATTDKPCLENVGVKTQNAPCGEVNGNDGHLLPSDENSFSGSFVENVQELSVPNVEDNEQAVFPGKTEGDLSSENTLSKDGNEIQMEKAIAADNISEKGKVKDTFSEDVKDLYQQAKESYEAGEFCDSLIYIDDALEMSNDAVLWILKAKLMNAMEDHLEALKAVSKVKAENRTLELWIVGAMALHKLGLLYTAEEWFKKVVMIRKDGDSSPAVRQQLAEAYMQLRIIRNNRIHGPLIESKPIKVCIFKTGRGVFSTEKISKDSIIFTELPEVMEHSIATSNLTVCENCRKPLTRPEDVFSKSQLSAADLMKTVKKLWPKRDVTPCRGCDRVVYCCESCEKIAWNSYHRVICPSSPNSAAAMLYDVRKSFRDVMVANGSSWQGWWNAEFSPTIMAKMWAVTLSQARKKCGDHGHPARDDWLKAFSHFEKYSTSGEETMTATIPKMFELMNSIFKRSKFLRFEITEADFNKKYNQILTNYISIPSSIEDDPYHQFVNRVSQDRKIYKKIAKYIKEPLPSAEFHGLFPLASCLNHSCLPNAELVSGLVDGGVGVVCKAKRNIPAQEEVLISYVDTALTRKERRETLMRRYKFWCQCDRCMYEGDGPDICTHCGKHAETEANWSTCVPSQEQESGTLGSTLEKSSRTESEDTTQNVIEPSGECDNLPETNSKSESTCNSDKGRADLTSEESKAVNTVECSELNDENIPDKLKSYGDTSEASAHTSNPKKSGKEVSASVKKFPRCSKCGRAWYCSQSCQKEAWKSGHKRICNKV